MQAEQTDRNRMSSAEIVSNGRQAIFLGQQSLPVLSPGLNGQDGPESRTSNAIE